MSPEEFLAAWDTPLVVLPHDAVRPTNLPPDAVDFLSRAGLPLGLAIGDEKLPYHVSFWRVGRGVTPVLDDFGAVPRLANTSVAHLAASRESRAQQCQRLFRALEAAAPDAWGDNEWAALAEHFESAEFAPVCTQNLRAGRREPMPPSMEGSKRSFER